MKSCCEKAPQFVLPWLKENDGRREDEGIYVVGFYFPVVPKGKARIRVQLSASHSKEELDTAINAFSKVGKKLNII